GGGPRLRGRPAGRDRGPGAQTERDLGSVGERVARPRSGIRPAPGTGDPERNRRAPRPRARRAHAVQLRDLRGAEAIRERSAARPEAARERPGTGAKAVGKLLSGCSRIRVEIIFYSDVAE